MPKKVNLEIETKYVRLPFITYIWNFKRSGNDFMRAFWNETMSGIVIIIRSNKPDE